MNKRVRVGLSLLFFFTMGKQYLFSVSTDHSGYDGDVTPLVARLKPSSLVHY